MLILKEQEVTLRSFDAHGGLLTTEGVTAKAAIGRGLAYFKKEREGNTPVWAMVHIPSGNVLNWVAFEHESSARRFVELIVRLLDWTNPSYKAISNHIAASELFIKLAEAQREAAKA